LTDYQWVYAENEQRAETAGNLGIIHFRTTRMSGISFRLTHKIMAIGLVGILGLVSFGLIYLSGSRSQDMSRSVADSARAVADLNHKLAVDMLEVRRAEKDFQLRRDEAYAKRQAELSSVILGELDQLRKLTHASGFSALAEKVDLVAKGFGNYAKEFTALKQAEVNLGLNETLGLSGELRNAVHGIETDLKQADNPKLTSGMLMLRRHEKDFMLRRDSKYVDELKQAAADFAKSVTASDLAPPVKAGIAEKLQTYQSAFIKWSEGAQDVARHGATMSKEFHQIEPLIADIEKDVAQRYFSAQASEADMRDSVKLWMLVAFVLALIVVSGASLWIGRSISTAILTMVRAMTRLAKGDQAVAIPGVGRKDEIGEMAGAVEVFKVNMIESDRLRAEQAEIEQRQAQQRKADMSRLADNFEAAIGEIVETVSSASTELEASASTLASTADRGQQLATTVASASEEATTNVQSVASATEELSSSVNEISRQVQESARMANEAVDQARRTNGRVSELSKAAGRIGDVVELINTIAGQTNLLALNATIEAARAGESGRGFAVVASEVKALAEQTAKATGEIGQQISGIQAATQESVGAIREISGTIERLSEISSTIAAAVEEQGAATQEISRNVQQAASGTQQVSSNIADVQHGATETGAASSQMLASAQSLSAESNRLKLEVGRFLETVRAA
jgi:methyl-accepting chemotaxis protein